MDLRVKRLCCQPGDDEQSQGMDNMIKNPCFVDIDVVVGDLTLKSMGPKRPEANGQKHHETCQLDPA